MDSPCIKQTVCKVLKIFQYGKYLVAYVLKRSKSDCLAFLLILLEKCLNPHEKSRSKLLTDNILHGRSSPPQQHKSIKYKWLALHLNRDVSQIDLLQPHFISCRVAWGGGGQEAMSS